MEIVLPEKIMGVETAMLKQLIMPIVLVVVLAMILNVVVMPKYRDIKKLSANIKKVKTETQKVTEKLNYLNSVPQDELAKSEELLAGSMLYEKDAYFLVSVIRTIADKFGYVVSGFSISPGKIKSDVNLVTDKKKAAKTLPVTMVLLGPKEAYLNLILELEKSLPILSLDKFEMKSKTTVAELNLIVSAHYFGSEASQEVKNLSLSDLKMDKKELDLIQTLGGFSNNRQMLEVAQSQVATRSGIIYGRDNPFIP